MTHFHVTSAIVALERRDPVLLARSDLFTRESPSRAVSRLDAALAARPAAARPAGELWAERGDMARAARYEERYVALRAHAEPELRGELETVRRRLASRRGLVKPGEDAARR